MADIRKGVTKSGFEYQVDAQLLNDMELLDDISEMENNFLNLSKVVRKVLGENQRKALYDHVRDENGRVPVDAVSAEFVEILSGTQQGKN